MNNFNFYTYSDMQIKQRHNSKMLYHSYLEALHHYNLSFRYKMVWQKYKEGYELLAKHNQLTNTREYLGKRDADTQKIASDFKTSKDRAKVRLNQLKSKLKRDEKLNKLEGIARTPNELVAIFRKINELSLDDKLIVIGTNSLYAYEAKAGVMIEEEHLATYDIDILNRKDKGLSFIFKEMLTPTNAVEFLQMIDKSFYQSPKCPYRFINDSGVWVELINPLSSSIVYSSFKNNLFSEIMPLAMDGMQWLENSRLFQETIIAQNGQSANITTIHPLEYAVYKNWLGNNETRDFQKHTRDLQQSRLVTKLIIEYMPQINIEKEVWELKHFKREIVEEYMEEVYYKDNSKINDKR